MFRRLFKKKPGEGQVKEEQDNLQQHDENGPDVPSEQPVDERVPHAEEEGGKKQDEQSASHPPAQEIPVEESNPRTVEKKHEAPVAVTPTVLTSEPESIAVSEQDEQEPIDEGAAPEADSVSENKTSKKGWFSRLTAGLAKTRSALTGQLGRLLLGKKEINDDILEELETILLSADLGVEVTDHIIEMLSKQLARKELKDGDAVFNALVEQLNAILEPLNQPLRLPVDKKPFVILMVGVNGAGKTTTIGKLAHQFKQQGKSVLLAAGDTFRAAAVEQLQAWGERNKVPVIAQAQGSDSASVIYDAVQAAKARGVDVLLADTAGRLHNKENLMAELQKVVRVIKKLDPEAPHEVMLVLDATTGQNALSQAKYFKDAVAVSGITMTKLDGTAKGGILFAIAERLQIPVRFVGVGEKAQDLQVFDAKAFVEALVDRET